MCAVKRVSTGFPVVSQFDLLAKVDVLQEVVFQVKSIFQNILNRARSIRVSKTFSDAYRAQGCQMAYFQTKKSQFG
jgi:hypothetical protein